MPKTLIRLLMAVLLVLLPAPSYAQKTPAQLLAEIAAQLPDNITGAITPAVLRGVLNDIVNSLLPTAAVSSKTTNYTVQNSDTGTTLDLGGGSNVFFALTFNGFNNYNVGFIVRVVNSDTTRGKQIVITGGSNFILWPGQTATVYRNASAWLIDRPRRWKLTGGALTINADSVNGSDTIGAVDGLATGASAFRTVNAALGVISDQFDFNAFTQSMVTVLMAADDSQEVHYPEHGSPIGSQGFASGPVIDGGGHSLTGGVNLFFQGSYLQIRNVTISNAAGDGLTLQHGAMVNVLDLVTFGATTGAQIIVVNRSQLIFGNNFTISGGSSAFLQVGGLGVVTAFGPINATVSANVTIGNAGLAVVYVDDGHVEVQGITFVLGGHTVTGKKFHVIDNAVLSGSANVPGTIAGDTGSGGQIP